MTLIHLKSTGHLFCRISLSSVLWNFFMVRLRSYILGKNHTEVTPFLIHHIKVTERQYVLLLVMLNWVIWIQYCLPSFSIVKFLFFPLELKPFSWATHTVALDWTALDPDWNHWTNVVFGHSWSMHPTAGCLLLGCFSLPDTRGRKWGQLPRYSSDDLRLSAPRSYWNISQCWYLESEPRNNTCSPSGLITLTNEWISLFFFLPENLDFKHQVIPKKSGQIQGVKQIWVRTEIFLKRFPPISDVICGS